MNSMHEKHTEGSHKLDYNQFKQILSRLSSVKSVRGKQYHSIQIKGEFITFVRESKTTVEAISIFELYNLFNSADEINTKTAERFISGRVQSPSVAIINTLKRGHVSSDAM